ncbi:PA2778 family cysteine peptidase [Thiobacter aerophilum]|uniref:PA2778 family cysteine peptidase n=1 Tax=Thiobacter aerophilum TaxID=3121275 RepID=A0ABV0EF15_9BURK
MLLVWLAGCAGTPELSRLRASPGALPPRVELEAVPFFPQDTHQCGPASLAMALAAAGHPVTPDALAPRLYVPERQGSLQVEMLAATRREGLLAYPLAPSLSDALTEVAAGTPVIVLQNLGLSALPLWHYAVVVGYDLDREEIILRSGLSRREVMPLTTFEHTWARSGYWAMLALPPSRLPATAREDAYVEAAVALERIGKTRAAHAAYATALSRWPRNRLARMGLGNTAALLGDWKEAETAFRQATADHPQDWAAYNNLAWALAQQKRWQEAIEAAERAITLAKDAAEPRRTLEEIRSKIKETKNQSRLSR